MVGPYGNRFELHVACDAALQRLAEGGGRPGSEKSRCVGMDYLTPVGFQ